MYEYTTTSTVRYGTKFEAKCFAEGDPLPRVRWLINDVEVSQLLHPNRLDSASTGQNRIAFENYHCFRF